MRICLSSAQGFSISHPGEGGPPCEPSAIHPLAHHHLIFRTATN